MSCYLSQLFEQEVIGSDVLLTGLANDSRDVKPGDLFFAYQGEQVDGHLFIEQAIERGAVAIALENSAALENADISYVQQQQLRDSLSAIAAKFYGEPSKQLSVAAITGTNGKTSISHYIAQLYQALGKPCAVIGTLGTFFGNSFKENINTTPDAISLQKQLKEIVDADIHYVAMEASSHALQQKRQEAVSIDVAVFSNLTAEHLDYHGDMQQYFAAKQHLFALPSVKVAVINSEDTWAEQLTQSLAKNVQVLDYALHSQHAYMYVQNQQIIGGQFTGELSVASEIYPFTLPLQGEFNLANAMAASCVLLARGEDAEQVIAAWQSLKPAKGRMQAVENNLAIRALVDYAHTADALENVLKNITKSASEKLIVVFGCGGNRDEQKRPLMAKVAECYADAVIVTDDNPRFENAASIRAAIIAGFSSDKYIEIADRQKAIEYAVGLAKQGDVIVVAGKGHEQVQIIADAIVPFDDVQVLEQALQAKEALC